MGDTEGGLSATKCPPVLSYSAYRCYSAALGAMDHPGSLLPPGQAFMALQRGASLPGVHFRYASYRCTCYGNGPSRKLATQHLGQPSWGDHPGHLFAWPLLLSCGALPMTSICEDSETGWLRAAVATSVVYLKKAQCSGQCRSGPLLHFFCNVRSSLLLPSIFPFPLLTAALAHPSNLICPPPAGRCTPATWSP